MWLSTRVWLNCSGVVLWTEQRGEAPAVAKCLIAIHRIVKRGRGDMGNLLGQTECLDLFLTFNCNKR